MIRPGWLIAAAVALLLLTAALLSFMWIIFSAAVAYGTVWDVIYLVAVAALAVILTQLLIKKIRNRKKK